MHACRVNILLWYCCTVVHMLYTTMQIQPYLNNINIKRSHFLRHNSLTTKAYPSTTSAPPKWDHALAKAWGRRYTILCVRWHVPYKDSRSERWSWCTQTVGPYDYRNSIEVTAKQSYSISPQPPPYLPTPACMHAWCYLCTANDWSHSNERFCLSTSLESESWAKW